MKFVYFPSDVPYFHLIDLSGVVDAATLVYRVTESNIPNSLPDTCRRLYLPGPPDGNFWLQPAPSVLTAIKFNGYRLTQVEEGDTTQHRRVIACWICASQCVAGDATCQVESVQTPTHDPHPGPWKGMTKRQRLSPPETQSANIVPILAQLLVRHHLHSRLSTVFSSNAITKNVHRLARTQSSKMHLNPLYGI